MGNTQSSNLSGVAASVFDFTSDFYKVLAKNNDKNYIYSTLSAHIALTMAAHGADGNTSTEMRKVLHLCDDEDKMLQEFQRHIDVLNTKQGIEVEDDDLKESIEKNPNNLSGDDTEEIDEEKIQRRKEHLDWIKMSESKLKVANKIYLSDKIQLKESYENALTTYFRSKCETLDFLKSDECAEIINKWCTEITNGKITNIVHPGEFSEYTALILINAVYFKGSWLRKFEYVTPKFFHLSTLNKIKVPTMKIKTWLRHRNLNKLSAKVVRLDFKESRIYMEFIIPNRINGLKNIEKNLGKISQEEYDGSMIIFCLPKFKIRSEINFKDYLIKMGMKDAFSEDLADFKKISEKKVFIKTVRQKAFIDVDEFGCEAAAVTAVAMDTKKSLTLSRRKIKKIKADRPFLFRIMDSRLNIPLFVGSVTNPIG